MNARMVLELIAGGVFLLVGIRSGVESFRSMEPASRGGERALLALHEAAKAGFWFALSAFFLGYALLDEPQGLRWFVLVPIGMAGLRLLAATLLAREQGPPS